MGDTNYLASVVKILEKPTQRIVNEKIVTTEFRAQLSQIRGNRIVNLVFWGNLGRDIGNYYQVNDYIMIEGYLSLPDKIKNKLTKRTAKKIQIVVLKLYII